MDERARQASDGVGIRVFDGLLLLIEHGEVMGWEEIRKDG